MDNNHHRLHPKNIYRTLRKYTPTLTGIVLFVLLIISVRYFVASLELYYQEGELHPHYHHDHTATSELNIREISTWMTFDYINVIYKLPSSYLKESLHIVDARYPNIRIGQYAKREGLNTGDFIAKIQESISTYSSH